MSIYSHDIGGYILSGEPVEAGPQSETFCFDISEYGTDHNLRVQLNMPEGSSLTVSETYFRSADLPNGWSSDGDPDGMPCLGYEEGGLIIPYLGEEKVGLSHSLDVTTGCEHDICFTIAAVDGGGQFTAKSGGQTLDNTSISFPGEYCINLSSGSYSDLDLEWTTTSGSMTLTDVEIIETCDIFTQVADVKSGKGYYPGGSLLPGRVFNSGSYRYGFNGEERDDEIKGDNNSINYKARIYDPRLMRFLSVDPLQADYPELTPYQFASNTPIWASDIDGLEARYETATQANGSTLITVTIDLKVKEEVGMSCTACMDNNTRARAIKSQIEESFSGYDTQSETQYRTKVNLTFTSEIDEKNDFYLEFVDATIDEDGTNHHGNGHVREIGNTEKNRFQVLKVGKKAAPWADAVTRESQKRTGAHEVGHGLGLKHQEYRKQSDYSEDGDLVDKNNLMRAYEVNPGTEITPEQLNRAKSTMDENKK